MRTPVLVHSMDNPLTALTRQISSAHEQLFNEPLGLEPHVDDPLKRLEGRVASGIRTARFAPPLTGIVADIEAAVHIRDHALGVDDGLIAYDLVARLLPPEPEPAPAPRSVMLTPAPPKKKPAPTPVSAPHASAGVGVIASVLIDAISTRDLPGAARAEAARLLSEGIALGDEALMREALATLITGV